MFCVDVEETFLSSGFEEALQSSSWTTPLPPWFQSQLCKLLASIEGNIPVNQLPTPKLFILDHFELHRFGYWNTFPFYAFVLNTGFGYCLHIEITWDNFPVYVCLKTPAHITYIAIYELESKCRMLMPELEMEYAILDIWLLECVFKWSVSRPISGSSESILARYVCQVVSKYTKLDSHGAECKSLWKVIGTRRRKPIHPSCRGNVCSRYCHTWYLSRAPRILQGIFRCFGNFSGAKFYIQFLCLRKKGQISITGQYGAQFVHEISLWCGVLV